MCSRVFPERGTAYEGQLYASILLLSHLQQVVSDSLTWNMVEPTTEDLILGTISVNLQVC